MMMPILVMAAARVTRSGFEPSESETPRNSHARDWWYRGGLDPFVRFCFRSSVDSRYWFVDQSVSTSRFSS